MFCPKSTTVSPFGVCNTLTGLISSMRRLGGPPGAMWVGGSAQALPGLVDEAGFPPACLLQTRVVRLAVVDVGRDDRPGRSLPRIVGRDDLFAPVGVAHDDLREQRGVFAIRIAACLPRE